METSGTSALERPWWITATDLPNSTSSLHRATHHLSDCAVWWRQRKWSCCPHPDRTRWSARLGTNRTHCPQHSSYRDQNRPMCEDEYPFDTILFCGCKTRTLCMAYWVSQDTLKWLLSACAYRHTLRRGSQSLAGKCAHNSLPTAGDPNKVTWWCEGQKHKTQTHKIRWCPCGSTKTTSTSHRWDKPSISLASMGRTLQQHWRRQLQVRVLWTCCWTHPNQMGKHTRDVKASRNPACKTTLPRNGWMEPSATLCDTTTNRPVCTGRISSRRCTTRTYGTSPSRCKMVLTEASTPRATCSGLFEHPHQQESAHWRPRRAMHARWRHAMLSLDQRGTLPGAVHCHFAQRWHGQH